MGSMNQPPFLAQRTPNHLILDGQSSILFDTPSYKVGGTILNIHELLSGIGLTEADVRRFNPFITELVLKYGYNTDYLLSSLTSHRNNDHHFLSLGIDNEPYIYVAGEDSFDYVSNLCLMSDICCFVSRIGDNVQHFRKNYSNNKLYKVHSFPYCEFNTLVNNNEHSIDNVNDDIFFKLHSILRDVDGFHADQALDELVKLIKVKYVSEQRDIGLFQMSNYVNSDHAAASIRMFYRNHVSFSNDLSDNFTCSNDAIHELMKVISLYRLMDSTSDVKGRAIQKVYNASTRSGMGQYFTPSELIDYMVTAVGPVPGDKIVDPFCGSGHFLTQSARKIGNTMPPPTLLGIDKSSRMCRVAEIDFMVHDIEEWAIVAGDSFDPDTHKEIVLAGGPDIRLTNPPFGSTITTAKFAWRNRYELTRSRKSVPLEFLGLELATKLLKLRGKLGIVLPEAAVYGRSTSYIRVFMQRHLEIKSILALPPNVFYHHGASVSTVIVIAQKVDGFESDNKTLMINLDEIKTNGRDELKTSMLEAAQLFKSYLEVNPWA